MGHRAGGWVQAGFVVGQRLFNITTLWDGLGLGSRSRLGEGKPCAAVP